MTATAHALVGSAIATAVPDPVARVILIVSSHFLLDMIPHWDFGTNWRNRPKHVTGAIAILDTLIGFALAYAFFYNSLGMPWIVLAPALANLPDWLEAPWYMFFARSNKTQPSASASPLEHLAFRVYKIENLFHTKADQPLGIVTQIATVAFFLFLLS